MRAVAGHALRESLRRRVFVVVAILTVCFLALYAVGVRQVFGELAESGSFVPAVDERVAAGATLLGLAMFATLFLGTVLAVFLTLGAIRSDAERGLLGPVLVRPISRRSVLAGRYLAAGGVCVAYVVVVFAAAVVITGTIGEWWPDRLLAPAAGLALGVALLVALSLAGSVVLAATANGIAIFMVFGAGMVAGLLGQIGEALGSDTLDRASEVATWVLPFEALYQQGLAALTADTTGLTRFAVSIGPFGGAEDAGPGIWPYSLAYLCVIGAVAVRVFARRDL